MSNGDSYRQWRFAGQRESDQRLREFFGDNLPQSNPIEIKKVEPPVREAKPEQATPPMEPLTEAEQQKVDAINGLTYQLGHEQEEVVRRRVA